MIAVVFLYLRIYWLAPNLSQKRQYTDEYCSLLGHLGDALCKGLASVFTLDRCSAQANPVATYDDAERSAIFGRPVVLKVLRASAWLGPNVLQEYGVAMPSSGTPGETWTNSNPSLF